MPDQTDEPMTYEPTMVKKLIVTILTEAIRDAKKGHNSSAVWLRTSYAASLAESVGFDACLWRDIWGKEEKT